MATSRPFAYNTGSTISGTLQVGNLAIGQINTGYTADYGGVKWWMGPNEDLGYIIAHETVTGTQPNPLSVPAYVGFWRVPSFYDSDFISYAQYVSRYDGSPQTFSSGTQASTWLTTNGYWNNYTGQTLPVQSGLILDWDLQNTNSYAGTGTVITDLEANSNGNLVGTIDYTSGLPNYLNVQGSATEYIVSTTNLNPDLSPVNTGTAISLFIWAYPTDNGVLVSEIGASTNPDAAGWHDSQLEIVSGQLKFRVWPTTSGFLTSNTAINLNTWNYIGLTYSGTTLTGYLNGNSVGTQTVTRQTPFNNGNTGLYYALGAPDFTSMGDGTGINFRFGGFHVYNKGLTASEVSQNYNYTKVLYGL